ncbi:MAG: DUF6464 family protein [Microcoleaceae cyanobacterium]
MQHYSLPIEIILTDSRQSLGSLIFDWTPQPGHYLELGEQTYLVLERRHCYQLKLGRYHLNKITLEVKLTERPAERTLLEGRWVLGEISCRYNARSELVRCAINPDGPCHGCESYESEKETR